MTEIKIPPEYKNSVVAKYLKRMLQETTVTDLVVRDGPCPTCITLPMCLNKLPNEILICPILGPLFHRVCLSLKYERAADISASSHIMRIHPLDVTFWIQRNDIGYGHVDIIENGYLQFIYYRVVFDREDIK